jgi:phosphate transport system substrate-binding protein
MNDDFLRRMRRPPSATFERQLRERLREQEMREPSRRRPDWRLLTIALLIGGSALATATYFTLPRITSPQPSSSARAENASPVPSAATQTASPEISRRISSPGENAATWTSTSAPASAQQDSPVSAARDNRSLTPTDSTLSGTTQTSTYISSTGPDGSAATRVIRVVMTPDVAPLVKDTATHSRHTRAATYAVDTADSSLRALCAEEPDDRPDVVITSRSARKEELRLCARRGHGGLLEATLGHVGVVVTRARSGTPMQLTTRMLRLALMKQVPAPDNSSQLIDNPYTHWNQIDPALEERRIEVLGPARDTPEFLVFSATILAPACENDASLDKQLCESLREDGVYAEAHFDANFIRQRLWSDPNVVAVIEYQFYAANSADLLGSLLAGAQPTRESIVNGSYVGARTLHAYVNRERHRNIPKVSSFVHDYLRADANLNQKVLISPDVSLAWRPSYNVGMKLTEVKLD